MGAEAGRPQIAELLNCIGGTHLFVGSRMATESEALLQTHNIIAIINVGVEPQPCRADVMITHRVRLGNTVEDPLLGFLPKAFEVIDAAAEEGGCCLIASEDGDDSEAGAAALAAGWLMASSHRIPWADAPALVRADRPSAQLNTNYERQLRVWSGWKSFLGCRSGSDGFISAAELRHMCACRVSLRRSPNAHSWSLYSKSATQHYCWTDA